MESTHFAIAFLGGLLPAIFWLLFWLREDKERPEPYRLILLSFVAGMAVIPLVLPLQHLAMLFFTDNTLLIAWVVIEEVIKYAVALVVILWNNAVDEPIDYIIYMIIIALGFAALENALFIFNPLMSGEFVDSILTGKFRFLGATLLHVLASGTVGACMAFSFYKKDSLKIVYATLGLFIAIVLHALFNFFIMGASGETSGQTIFLVFLFVWMGIVLLLIVFEKVKIYETEHNTPKNYEKTIIS